MILFSLLVEKLNSWRFWLSMAVHHSSPFYATPLIVGCSKQQTKNNH
jgi:hypothetical protein